MARSFRSRKQRAFAPVRFLPLLLLGISRAAERRIAPLRRCRPDSFL